MLRQIRVFLQNFEDYKHLKDVLENDIHVIDVDEEKDSDSSSAPEAV